MRYAIGAHSVNRETREPFEGLYVFGKLGMPFVLTPQNKDFPLCRIPIFSDIDDAQKFLTHLSKKYKVAFDAEAVLTKSPRSEFRFFLVKVDSSNFQYSLHNGKRKNGQEHDVEYPSRMYYDLRLK